MPMRTRSLVQSPTESLCGRLKVGGLNGWMLATRCEASCWLMFCASMTLTHWVSPLPGRGRHGEAVWLRYSASPCLSMTRCRALPGGFSTPPSAGLNCCFKVEPTDLDNAGRRTSRKPAKLGSLRRLHFRAKFTRQRGGLFSGCLAALP